MNIEDFLPKYPSVEQSKYPVLNPYDDFYEALYHKKEFYENRLERTEVFPKERGMLTKYQKTIARYMSSHTPYDRFILIHSMGLGKTCSAIGAIEQIKNETSLFKGALILARGDNMLDNFSKEAVFKCTPGYYIPENYDKLNERTRVRRISKKLSFYEFETFIKLAKKIKAMSDEDIVREYSNRIIVVDEVHNLRIQKKELAQTLEIYNEFHRFFHLVQNCKIMFLSGTPMKDTVDEIASILNFLLPLNNQFPTGDDFIQEYMTAENDTLKIKEEKREEFKQKTKGLVSFLREAESTVPREYIGDQEFGGLKHFVVAPNKMSKFQSKNYKKAYERDEGIYTDTREASLFVFPDGSYGKKGFEKYIKETKKKKGVMGVAEEGKGYKMEKELKDAIYSPDQEEMLRKLAVFSSIYAQVIRELIQAPGNCFVYSFFDRGGGCILFSLILELFGFGKANGKEKSKGLRYCILTGHTATNTEILRITERFNRKDNLHGEFIKIIIGGKAISEGYSFRNVIFEAILTPHWNYSETAQALARGIRLGSHNDLLEIGETPVVRIIQPVSMPRSEESVMSIDLHLYKTSEDKDISIRGILRLLMESAVDCALNYMRNYTDGVDGSRECFYTTCNYQCDGINMGEVETGIPEKDLDFSTYQLYYSDPKTPLIYKKIEAMFRLNSTIGMDSIIQNLKDQFSEDEIRNALFSLQEEKEDGLFDHKTFLEIYSRTPVKKIMNKIESLFKGTFRIELQSILDSLKEYTEFEVLNTLNIMINESVVLTDQYGFPCYLRENSNIYFLVSNVSIISGFYTGFYSKYPFINASKNFSELVDEFYSSSIPKIIESLFKVETEKDFVSLLNSLPKPTQSYLLEASVVAEDQGIKRGEKTRNRILEYFKSYIKKVENTWVVTLKGLRCLEVGSDIDMWRECEEKYGQILEEIEEEEKKKIRDDNKYGIMGKYSDKGVFCIVDFEKEQKSREKVSEKRAKGLVDKRINHPGKVCTAGWRIAELVRIAAIRLKIEPPDTFLKNASQERMMAILKSKVSERDLSEITPEEMSDKDTLRRILYFSLPKKEGGTKGIKPICEVIREWLKVHELLQKDNSCGDKTRGGASASKTETGKVYRIETIVPQKEEDRFKEIIKEISKMMTECFGVKKYTPEIDNRTWILAYSRKKIVGFLTLDENNIIWNVCVAKNYRNRGLAKEIMRQAVVRSCSIGGRKPTLLVDNKSKDQKKLVNMYLGFGFVVSKSDDAHTYMIYPC